MIFPILLILALVVLAAIAGLMIRHAVVENEDGWGFAGGVVVIVVVICSVVLGVFWPSHYIGSMGTISEMEAFFEDTKDTYAFTTTQTGEVHILNSQPGLIDVAYFEQGKVYAQRLREFRDKVEWYNYKLQWFDRFNGAYAIDPFLADVPEHLKPITIDKELLQLIPEEEETSNDVSPDELEGIIEEILDALEQE